MAAPEALRQLRVSVVKETTAAGAAAMEATAATQAPPEAVAEAAMAVTAVTAPEAAAVTAAMAVAAPAAEAVAEAATAAAAMEATVPDLDFPLALGDLPLAAVVVMPRPATPPEIFRRQAAPAYASLNITYTR